MSFLLYPRLCTGVMLFVTACVAGHEAILDFEQVVGKEIVLAGSTSVRAVLKGGAAITDEAYEGTAALDLGGITRKGVVSLGPTFASSKAGTLALWCKPRVVSGIIVGKYGAINVEFVRGRNQVRFGLKPKGEGWVHCTSPSGGVSPHRWLHIRASWGSQGMMLWLDGRAVAHAPLPRRFEWFIPDRSFLLGSYDWPGGYDSWFLDGLIDRVSFRPEQADFPASLPGKRHDTDLLPLKLRASPKPAYGIPKPARVRGRVVIDADGNGAADPGEKGVPGVAVSDGYSVVLTDAAGAYEFRPSAHAVFVFISRPSEHDVRGSWYQPVAPTVDFLLGLSADPEDHFTFVQVTDTHVSDDPRSLAGLSWFVREVNALRPLPRFVFNSGDLVNLDKQLKASDATGRRFFRNYTGMMNRLRMPYYNVAGDHTDSGYRLDAFPRGDHRAGKAMYWEHLGPNLFSFNYGRLHFVSVDVVYHLDKVRHEMIPEHLVWLEQDLAVRPADSIALTASENPLDGSVPHFAELADHHDIRLQLVGDTHVVSFRQRPVPSRAHGALSGTWWNGPCADLNPPGYMIYEVRGTELDCFYKGLGQRIVIVAPGYGKRVTGTVSIQAHLVQPRHGESLQFSVDGGEWQDMTVADRPFYRATYRGTWDSTAAPDGVRQLTVRVVPGSETRDITLVSDNARAEPTSERAGTLTLDIARVIAANIAPRHDVSIIFNERSIGTLPPGAKGDHTFPVPAGLLRTVNVLSFGLQAPDDRFTLGNPVLTIGDMHLEDPRASAVQAVRSNHWPDEIVARSGFAVGTDVPETSFLLRQDTFLFVLTQGQPALE